jgi:hypothetical protein
MSTAIKISYYGEPNENYNISEFVGISDFKNNLERDYTTFIRQKTDGYGAGFYEFVVEIISDITLNDFITFLLTGTAFDLVKYGTKNFAIQPFLNAYKKLRTTNKEVDIEELRFSFKDSNVIIYRIYQNSILEELENILLSLSINYDKLFYENKERPYQIDIPVFEDPIENNGIDFRFLLSVDEPIQNTSSKDYFKFWGAYYQFRGWKYVYDCLNKKLMDATYHNTDSYSKGLK